MVSFFSCDLFFSILLVQKFKMFPGIFLMFSNTIKLMNEACHLRLSKHFNIALLQHEEVRLANPDMK